MVYITRRETFNAAHKLYNKNWTPEQNDVVFGKCANKNWHGHNYELFVTIKGTPNADTGFIMNVKELSQLIKKNIIDVFDHKNLNMDVSFPLLELPSTENLAIVIWQLLEPLIAPEAQLHCIKLQETENIYVEYYGEN